MNANYMSTDEAQAVDNLMPGNQAYIVGTRLKAALDNNGAGFPADSKIYVDDVNGSDLNDGKSWETAFKTIMKGLNTARYIPSTTTIDTDRSRHKFVYVAPGQYNERILFSGYNIHLIGCGPRSNGDYGVVVNYDDAIASTAVFGFTGAGLEVAGICFNGAHAIPLMLLGSSPDVADACWIHDCWFKGDNSKTVTIGISAYCKNSLIENNIINGCIAGINVAASAWFYNTIVVNNKITNVTNGIAIANGATPGESMIDSNFVIGSSSSIVNSQATDVIITKNYTKPAYSDAGSASGDNVTLA